MGQDTIRNMFQLIGAWYIATGKWCFKAQMCLPPCANIPNRPQEADEEEGESAGQETEEEESAEAEVHGEEEEEEGEESGEEAASEEEEAASEEDEEEEGSEEVEEEEEEAGVQEESEEQAEVEKTHTGPRSRKHIADVLGFAEIGTEEDREEEALIESILKELKKLSVTAIEPMEKLYKFKDISTRLLGGSYHIMVQRVHFGRLNRH